MPNATDLNASVSVTPLRVHASHTVQAESDLPLPAMRSLFVEWQRACGGAGVPRLDALEPALAQFADDLLVLEVEHGTDQYRYLLHGAHVALHFGRDMTGQRTLDLPTAIASLYHKLFAKLAHDREPLYCRVDAAAMVPVEYWDRLLLPVTANGSTVDRIVVQSIPRAWRSPPGAYLELSRSLNQLEEGLCVVDGTSRVHTWNRALLDMYAIDQSVLRRNMPLAAFLAAAREPLSLPLTPQPRDDDKPLNLTGTEPHLTTSSVEQILPDGRVLHLKAVRGADGGVAVTVMDISKRVAAEFALRAANENLEGQVRARTRELTSAKNHLEATLKALPEAVFSVDLEARVTYANPTAAGWCAPKRDVHGHHLDTLLELRSEETNAPVALPVRRCIEYNESFRGDRTSLQFNGSRRPRNVLELITPTHGPDGEVTGAVVVLQDITDSRREERRIRYAATHDDLTGCPNRKALAVDLATSLERRHQFGENSALIFLDLDGFKAVNDQDGHSAGDAFLRQVADKVRTCVRVDDTVSRFGGDEFVVLLKNCPERKARNIASVIVARLAEVQLAGERTTHVGAGSLGLAVIDDTSVTSDTWLERADEAAYAAKRAGGNRVFVWGPAGNVHLPAES